MAVAPHIREAYRLMRAAYPRWAAQQDIDSARLWASLLEDVSADALGPAIRRLAMASKWPPTIAEIREAAGAQRPAAELTGFAKQHAEALAGHHGERAQRLAKANPNPTDWHIAMHHGGD